MAIELDCRLVTRDMDKQTKQMVSKFRKQTGRNPKLVTVVANDDPASERYIRNKMRVCDCCDIEHKDIVYKIKDGFYQTFENGISCDNRVGGYSAIEKEICRIISNNSVDGIMVQLPLYDGIDSNKVIQLIDPAKDVDCLTAENMGRLALGDNAFVPATVRGILELFKFYDIDLLGKNVIVRGRSNIVGKPMTLALINEGASVISTNSHSKASLEDVVMWDDGADIIIDSSGVVSKTSSGCDYYIDVTTIVDKDGKMHGSILKPDRKMQILYYTPVPGGVGPLTCSSLAFNTAYLACKNAGIEA